MTHLLINYYAVTNPLALAITSSEMFGYVTSLRTLSSGRATSTMEFSHYAATPSSISEQVIKKANGSTDS